MENSPDLFPDEDNSSFEAAFSWWEKRRLRYNLIVGIPGVLLVLIHGIRKLDTGTVMFILVIGLAANGCYCLGYLLEFFMKYYFRSDIDFAEKRNTIYWTGVLISLVLLGAIAILDAITQ